MRFLASLELSFKVLAFPEYTVYCSGQATGHAQFAAAGITVLRPGGERRGTYREMR